MKVLSLDPGIKNLSFCLLDKNEINSESPTLDDKFNNVNIFYWDVINLTNLTSTKCSIDNCNKSGKWQKHNICYCAVHSRKQPYIQPNKELKMPYLKKQKIDPLKELAEKWKIKSIGSKKADILQAFEKFIEDKCYEPIDKINAKTMDLVTIGKNIQKYFDQLLDNTQIVIDQILIENQIGPLAAKMKTIQGMLSQYFIMKNNNINILFVNATNKLKKVTNQPFSLTETEDSIDMDTSTYSERKKLGVSTITKLLKQSSNSNNKWIDHFMKHKKKDDLADCLLQAL